MERFVLLCLFSLGFWFFALLEDDEPDDAEGSSKDEDATANGDANDGSHWEAGLSDTGFNEVVVGIEDFDIEDFSNFFLGAISKSDGSPDEDWIDTTLGWGAGDLTIFSGAHASWELVVDLFEVDGDVFDLSDSLGLIAFAKLGIISEAEADLSGFVDVDLVGTGFHDAMDFLTKDVVLDKGAVRSGKEDFFGTGTDGIVPRIGVMSFTFVIEVSHHLIIVPLALDSVAIGGVVELSVVAREAAPVDVLVLGSIEGLVVFVVHIGHDSALESPFFTENVGE